MSPLVDVEILVKFESFDTNDKSFTISAPNENYDPFTLM